MHILIDRQIDRQINIDINLNQYTFQPLFIVPSPLRVQQSQRRVRYLALRLYTAHMYKYIYINIHMYTLTKNTCSIIAMFFWMRIVHPSQDNPSSQSSSLPLRVGAATLSKARCQPRERRWLGKISRKESTELH